MWKLWSIFFIGFLVMVVPMFGLPVATDVKIFFIFGAASMVLAFLGLRDLYFLRRLLLRLKEARGASDDDADGDFVQNNEPSSQTSDRW